MKKSKKTPHVPHRALESFLPHFPSPGKFARKPQGARSDRKESPLTLWGKQSSVRPRTRSHRRFWSLAEGRTSKSPKPNQELIVIYNLYYLFFFLSLATPPSLSFPLLDTLVLRPGSVLRSTRASESRIECRCATLDRPGIKIIPLCCPVSLARLFWACSFSRSSLSHTHKLTLCVTIRSRFST